MLLMRRFPPLSDPRIHLMSAPIIVLGLFLALLLALFVAGCVWGLNRNHEADRDHES
jgi:hypothetical protein